ncbi:MAG: hypothetical protein Q6364_00985 [Candidatus Hermodarchaeota archaeon]|nr:hypothetical protein [Candidatus Hermodarchaeota archaeon]
MDLVCICDGHLFAAECKTLNEVSSDSKTWSNIAEELGSPIDLAKKAGFEGFIVSSLSENYPQNFQKKLKLSSKGKIKVSYLNKNDLTSGRRKIRRGDHEWPITVDDLLSQEVSKKSKTKKKKGKRTIRF